MSSSICLSIPSRYFLAHWENTRTEWAIVTSLFLLPVVSQHFNHDIFSFKTIHWIFTKLHRNDPWSSWRCQPNLFKLCFWDKILPNTRITILDWNKLEKRQLTSSSKLFGQILWNCNGTILGWPLPKKLK